MGVPVTITRQENMMADAETIFGIWTKVEEWQHWTPTIKKIKRLNEIPFDKGTRVKIWQPKLSPAIWEITELREGRSFKWIKKSPGITISATHTIEPKCTGCLVEFAIRYEGLFAKMAYRYTQGLATEYMETELKALKGFCEYRAV